MNENLSQASATAPKQNYTHSIVSRAAYLIGVPETFFHEGTYSLRKDLYDGMEAAKECRILRGLAKLRTYLFQHYSSLNAAICYNLKNLDTVGEAELDGILDGLKEDGIDVIKPNWMVDQYGLAINDKIRQMVGMVRDYFPSWLPWDILKEFFYIPEAKSAGGIKAARKLYSMRRTCFPYSVYTNIKTDENSRFMLYDDFCFLSALYRQHGMEFTDEDRVKDTSFRKKESILGFLEADGKADILVDCENVDVFKFFNVLEGLSAHKDRIGKILLYDDVHTKSAWHLIRHFTDIPVEHQVVLRVKEDKSLVDMSLGIGAAREHFVSGISRFILVSSDSDYCALIRQMPECSFFVMTEKGKASAPVLTAMLDNGVEHCHIDDFCAADLSKFREEAIRLELNGHLSRLAADPEALLAEALESTGITYSCEEMDRFRKRYLGKIHAERPDGPGGKVRLAV